MYVYRYMSKEEFRLMSAGADIVGKTRYKARTNSTGVCFLPETVEFERDGEHCDVDAMFAYRFLAGIVSKEVLVKFWVDEEDFRETFATTYGIYADPFGGWNDITATELCTQMYNRDMLDPVSYCIPDAWEWWDYK